MKIKNQAVTRLVRDDVTGDWVILAGARKDRPTGYDRRAKDPFSPSAIREGQDLLAMYGTGEHVVAAIKNKYPVFGPGLGIGGHHELLIEGTSMRPFWTSTVPQIVALLDAFAARFIELRKDPSIKYLQGFKNEGREAGASQPHPHSQILAVPFLPERMKVIAKRRRNAPNVLSLATKMLTIFQDKYVVAFANPSARYAYEVRIIPRRFVDSIVETTAAERHSIAKAFQALFPLMKKRKFAYNFFFHDVPADHDEHFEIRFVPRVEVSGGFELDAGVFVNPVLPELAAEEYRTAQK